MNEHKSYIFFDQSGNPLYCFVPGSPEDVQNELYGPLSSIVEIPEALQNTSHDYILESVYRKEGAIKVRPPRPAWHDWDSVSESWLPNLDVARESQRQAWNAWRDRELIASYTHNGHVFHSDDRFMAELQLILKGYERGHLTGTSTIRTRDNGTLQMTHTEIEGLLLLIGLHRQAIYAQSWTGKDALVGLTTLEDIVAGGPPE